MCGYNKKDISDLDYTMISLLSNKINVVIIGGGEAALIKCKSFAKNDCNVTVVAKNFKEDFYNLEECSNVFLIRDEYDEKYLEEKHLIIIATDNESINAKIKKYCDENYKLYLHCGNYKYGVFVSPVQRNTENMKFAIHTKSSSPKTSLFIAKMMQEKLNEYDDFVDYTCNIRQRVKNKQYKKEIMNFICSDDFYFFYIKGLGNKVLKMFYDFI